MSRLFDQIRFIVELDKLKGIQRQSWLADGTRQENSAEHSWHIALMALVLAEHADEVTDIAHVVSMLLAHDIVEIDAGDVLVYDTEARTARAARELDAANRIYGLLPGDQAKSLVRLWREFEAGETAEARFARALDRLMPLLHNFLTEGRAWRQHGITARQVRARNQCIALGSSRLWDYARSLIDEAVERGYLAP